MKYSVDRIEGDIAILQNIDTLEILEVDIDVLPFGIKDGSIVKYDNYEYTLDTVLEENRRNMIREKLNRLKRLNN